MYTGRMSGQPKGMPVAWHHSSLAVSHIDRAMAFYSAAFGFEATFVERGMSDQIASIAGVPNLTCDIAQLRSAVSGHVLELIAFLGMPPGHERPLVPGMAHVAFFVDDLDLAIAHVAKLGAVQLGAVTAFSDGSAVYFREPGGSFFEMEQVKSAGQ
ncbi:MAG: VOC family protein [Alphaproteobacteria bacterium]|nr:VOC family protein [Alphaproteobacteria bacterium]